MKIRFLLFLVLAISLYSFPAFTQTGSQAEADTTLLGLPGDNLDLFAVLDLFQKSPSIEGFEKSLNLEETGINNLDLNLDGKVDFIKVVTEQDKEDFTFVLQVDVSEKEVQDVAVILVSKDENKKVTMQAVGDKDLYGKDYVVEPAPAAPAVTANPAYTGANPVTSTTTATEVIIVESAPIVQYVYSPVYVPYYPPYTYSYYPPYFAAFTVMAIGVYHHNHYYHYNGYHGGYHGNTVIINNNNNYNRYNNSRNSSNTVTQHNSRGDYNTSGASASTRPSTGQAGGASAATRPSTGQAGGASAATRPSTGQAGGASAATRPSTGQAGGASATTRPSTGQAGGASAATRPSTGQAGGASAATRPTSSYSSQSSASRNASSSRSMSSSSSMSSSRSAGASRSMGGGGGRRR